MAGTQHAHGTHSLAKQQDAVSYAQTSGAVRLFPRAATNVEVSPFHWITSINVRVDRPLPQGLRATTA